MDAIWEAFLSRDQFDTPRTMNNIKKESIKKQHSYQEFANKLRASEDKKEWETFACEMQFSLFCYRVKRNISMSLCSTETGLPAVQCSVFKKWLIGNRKLYVGQIQIIETTEELYTLRWSPCVFE